MDILPVVTPALDSGHRWPPGPAHHCLSGLISSDNCPVATLIRIARVGATLNTGENTHFRISSATFRRKKNLEESRVVTIQFFLQRLNQALILSTYNLYTTAARSVRPQMESGTVSAWKNKNTWKGKLHKSNAEQTVYRFQIIINS